jgi:hypothetical protein
MEDDRGSDFYFVVRTIVFFGVWIACAIAGGVLGFIFGWIPALILAFIWLLLLDSRQWWSWLCWLQSSLG